MTIGVVGGGIIGLSIAYKLSCLGYRVELHEKENNLAEHQTGRNSGVLHCGLSYKPGSLKAQLARDGVRQMITFCKDFKIDFEQCGKIVVAKDEDNHQTLLGVLDSGRKNGLKGLRLLSRSELRSLEPNVNAYSSAFVPEEGIVDYVQVCHHLRYLILNNGGEIHLNSEITDHIQDSKRCVVRSNAKEYVYDKVIFCGGVFSDRIFKQNNKNTFLDFEIIPFRGEYFELKERYSDIFNGLIYPVPEVSMPFLGVHFTRTISNKKLLGPNAVLAFSRLGYQTWDYNSKDFKEIIKSKGLRIFLKNNFFFCLNQLKSSLSETVFLNEARKLVPALTSDMIQKSSAGIRAQGILSNGTLALDFEIKSKGGFTYVLNAPSPGASASLAIADYIIKNKIGL